MFVASKKKLLVGEEVPDTYNINELNVCYTQYINISSVIRYILNKLIRKNCVKFCEFKKLVNVVLLYFCPLI